MGDQCAYDAVAEKKIWGVVVETQVLIAAAVNYGEEEMRNQILKDIDEEQKMLISFMNKFNK